MSNEIEIRHPRVEDGAALWRLVKEIDDLEVNTCYAYLLLCSHFSPGSMLAVRDGELIGCVLGYCPPTRPDAMFVWQVGVRSDARGQGLAIELLERFVALPVYRGRQYLEATVGRGNTASTALFTAFARKRNLAVEREPGFGPKLFAHPGHDTEDLFRIGPLRS